MALDIKEKVDEIVEKIKGDPKKIESFTKDPIKAIEGMIGVDLPDEKIKEIIEGIKEKLNLSSVGDFFKKIF